MQLDYTEWEKILNEHKAAMDKELAEVRQYKQELVQMKAEMMELGFVGKYERDTNTLILSAPNIVIGNVDKNGNLMEGDGNVVIKGHNISLEGIGQTTGESVTGGEITSRARYINNITVDPGIDGVENVAFGDSRFTVQSASIGMVAETIDPDPSGGVFTLQAPASEGSIDLRAEISINATAACDITDENNRLDNMATQIEETGKGYEEAAEAAIQSVKSNSKALDKNLDNGMLDLLGASSEEADTLALRTGLYEFDERGEETEAKANIMAKAIANSAQNMSVAAESKRVAKYLKARSQRLTNEASTYADEPTGTSINLIAESINMATEGADGAIRKSVGNGVTVTSQNVTFAAQDGYEPIEDSTFHILANDINMDASTYTYEEKDGDIQLSQTEAKGKIRLNAHDVEMTGNDYALEGEELKPVLTQGSLLYTNFSNTHIDMTDDQGKAQGVFLVDAKDVYLSSYDMEPESRVKPTGVAEGGMITMGAQKVVIGNVVKDMKCESVQVSANQLNLMGDEKVNLQQTQDKSHLLLDDNAELSGGNLTMVGKITLGGETKIDAKFTAGDVELQNLKAASSITGPNIKDGIPVPGAAPAAQPAKGADFEELEPIEKIRETNENNEQ